MDENNGLNLMRNSFPGPDKRLQQKVMPKRDPSPKLALLKAGKKEEPPKLFSKRFQMPPKQQIKPQ